MHHAHKHINNPALSIPENCIGLLLFFVGINLLLINIPLQLHFAPLYIAGITLLIGLWFLIDYFMYKTLSSVLPGFVLPIFSLLLLLDSFASFSLSYPSLIFTSVFLGGSIGFYILFTETTQIAYKAVSWIFGIIFLLQMMTKSVFVQKYTAMLWPILLILAGIILLINVRKHTHRH